jgi:DNA-binding NarL/FixJ family response regulator
VFGLAIVLVMGKLLSTSSMNVGSSFPDRRPHVDPSGVGRFRAGGPWDTSRMAVARWSIARLVDEIALLADRGMPPDDYFREASARLGRVVDYDATCWHTLDPETRLITSDAPHELVELGVFTAETAPAAGAGVVASEYFRSDFNTFAALAARRVPVGILSGATRGRPERSARYREVLVPAGIPFELRAAFVSRGRCWGAVHVARLADRPDFVAADAAALARAGGTIADGIRTAILFDAARRPDDPTAPGLVVLDPANEVELITAPARELFTALRSSAVAESDETPPTPLLALAAHARTRSSREAPAAIAVPTASGWITLHASLPEGRAGGRVAIVVGRSGSPHATALRLEAHGVTAREREVAALLAQGLSNDEIAVRLVLSPFTVQDHVKSVFEKTGVASRRELVARIFLDDYLPNVVQRKSLTSTGGFTAEDGSD